MDMDVHEEIAPDVPWTVVGKRIVLLSIWVCTAFTLSATAFLLVIRHTNPIMRPQLQAIALWPRAILFGIFTLICTGLLYREIRGRNFSSSSPPRSASEVKTTLGQWFLGISMLFLIGVILFSNASVYPWAAPDEVHHLTVTKNLAEQHIYASGGPAVGFRRFDPYDSVGAPVLMPIAMALGKTGFGIVPARRMISGFYLLLCIVSFFLLRPLYGSTAALLGVFMATLGFSSFYLARTLYGEVPALFYFILGLVLWRRALQDKNSIPFALLAGLALGCAVLSKTILALSLFAFAGVWLYDRFTHKYIRLRHTLPLAAGAMIIFLLWWGYQRINQGEITEQAQGTIGLYQHYLLFGLRPFFANFMRSVGAAPWMHIMLVIGMTYGAWLLLRHTYDPPCLVLYLVAVFYAYWWLFFTPGQLPRYLWFSYYIGGLFIAPVLVQGLQWGKQRRHTVQRYAVFLGCLLLLLPFAYFGSGQIREIYTNQEMVDDFQVAEMVRALPQETAVATTFFPMRPTLLLLADRSIVVGDNLEDLTARYPVVIAHRDTVNTEAAIPAGMHRTQVGRYWIFRRLSFSPK